MTPEELEKLPKPLERTMSAVEIAIMEEIIERLKDAEKITPVTDWMLYRLTLIGASKKELKRQIQEGIKHSVLDIDKIYETALQSDYIRNKEIYKSVGMDYQPYEENEWLQQIVEAVRRQTSDTLRSMENITKTTGFNIVVNGKKVFTPLSEYLEHSLDEAMMKIMTGLKTYSQAIGDVIDEMTDSGLRMVDYASGKSERIEVVARRAIMTGVAQITDKVNEMNAEKLGTDYWEVDWHMGARNTGTGYLNHQSWQGKVYNSEQMRTVCGLGQMLGFAGINCYHIRFPFIPGVSKRKYTDEWLEEQNHKENEKKLYRGREYDTYKALQHQRKLERTIRKQKQEIRLLEQSGADKKDVIAAKSRLQLTNKTYKDFSEKMGLREQRERLRIPKGTFNSVSNDAIIKEIKIPRESIQASGVPEDIVSEIQDGIDEIMREYDVKIHRAGIEDLNVSNPNAPYITRYVNNQGMKEVEFIINKGYDFTNFREVLKAGYEYGYFAGKTIKDHAIHEMAHAMTGQQYMTYAAFDDFFERVDKQYVAGVSGYADATQSGFETIAEAFVRLRNGEDIPMEARKLVESHIERWRKH